VKAIEPATVIVAGRPRGPSLPPRRAVDWLRAAAAVTVIALVGFLLHAGCRHGASPAQPELSALAPITAADRILIVAPHEDDEALAVGGVIQQARAAGAKVRAVYLTYGDHNEFAFIVYRKRPWISPSINRNMGEVRRKEAIAGTGQLGLAPGALTFLGYPDGGLLGIWKEHWGQAPPLHSLLTNARAVPYQDAASYGKAYKGENLAGDLAAELLAFKPTRVFVGHPADSHPDHRASWLFLEAALLQAAGRIEPPEVLAFPIHAGAWPRPKGEHPDEWLDVPRRLADSPGSWTMLGLTPEQARLKAAAIRLYPSQTSISKGYLLSFARRNELFARVPPIRLAPPGGPGPGDDPRPHALIHGATDPGPDAEDESGPEAAAEAEAEPLGSVVWRDSGEALVVEVRLRQVIVAGGEVRTRAFGFRPGRPFAAMPKLQASWTPGWLRVYDQGVRVVRENIKAVDRPGLLTVTIPWADLDNPEKVFVQVDGSAGEMTASQTGWRLLERARSH
jgi:LmbE family N-acetylglucosaminyl deacetylase/nitrogen fixation protein